MGQPSLDGFDDDDDDEGGGDDEDDLGSSRRGGRGREAVQRRSGRGARGGRSRRWRGERRRRLAAKAADPIVPEIWLPSATTPTALRAVFLANTRCARCSGAGQRTPLWLNALPLTAHPGRARRDGVFKRGAAPAEKPQSASGRLGR